MKRDIPTVTVLMPVYNAELYLKEAIDSILNQTYQDFEFLIINDGSTDKTVDIINGYQDTRIILLNNNENLTIVPCLNKGIKHARGKYIIRMDADDISAVNRLETQVTYMDQNKDVGVCGSWAESIDGQGQVTGQLEYETEDVRIKIKFLHECHLLHPSVVIRRSVLVSNNILYDAYHYKSEDYELFARLMNITKFANISQHLLKYRSTETSLARETSSKLTKYYTLIRSNLFKEIGMPISAKQLDIYGSLCYFEYEDHANFLSQSKLLLDDLYRANNRTEFLEVHEFNQYISTLWENLCRNIKGTGLTVFFEYSSSTFEKNRLRKAYILLIIFFKNIFGSSKKNKLRDTSIFELL